MCFSQEMSACIAAFGFTLAAYEHRAMNCPQYTVGILYYASMELLQAVQYAFIAEPDDNYAMCANNTNQALTVLAGLHICFQPLFTNILFSSFFRTKNIQDRIESDLIQRLSIFAAFWYAASYYMAILSYTNDPRALPSFYASEECPNFDWVREGFDGYSNTTTPNIPGHSCTFRPSTETNHLAWVFPLYQHTYFLPSGCIHFFLFFAPYIMSRRFCLQRMGIMMLAAGPYLAAQMTPSLHEQPAIWCLLSIFEIAFLSIRARMCGYITEPIPEKLVHPGGFGEEPLVYSCVNMMPKDKLTTCSSNDNSAAVTGASGKRSAWRNYDFEGLTLS